MQSVPSTSLSWQLTQSLSRDYGEWMPTTSTRERPFGRNCSQCGSQIEVTVQSHYIMNHRRGTEPYKTTESPGECTSGCVGIVE